jgi:large subunit ribosomal protein L4
MATPTYSKTGNKATAAVKLDKAIFEVEIKNHELLKQAYLTYLANDRGNLAVTKTRGLVRGGGRKPWQQKGTGRARFGSSRNPIWRGGGIAFGPTGGENYSKSINTKAKRQAIRQAFTLAATDNKLIVIEQLESKAGKTAELSKLLDKITVNRNALLIVETKTPELIRASKNLPGIKLVGAKFVSVFDLLNADHVVIDQPALKVVSDWLKPLEAKK